MEERLRYSLFVDGREVMEISDMKGARFHAIMSLLNAKEIVEIYDSESDSIIEEYHLKVEE